MAPVRSPDQETHSRSLCAGILPNIVTERVDISQISGVLDFNENSAILPETTIVTMTDESTQGDGTTVTMANESTNGGNAVELPQQSNDTPVEEDISPAGPPAS